MSHPDDNPTLRLYVPHHPHEAVVKQYHADNGHIGVQKTLEGISKSTTSQIFFRNFKTMFPFAWPAKLGQIKKVKPPFQEMDIPFTLDLSGLYHQTLSGNKYIVAFVQWLSRSVWCAR